MLGWGWTHWGKDVKTSVSRKSDSATWVWRIPGGSGGCPSRAQQLVCIYEYLKAQISTSFWCHHILLGGVVALNQSKGFFKDKVKIPWHLGGAGRSLFVSSIVSQMSLCCTSMCCLELCSALMQGKHG